MEDDPGDAFQFLAVEIHKLLVYSLMWRKVVNIHVYTISVILRLDFCSFK